MRSIILKYWSLRIISYIMLISIIIVSAWVITHWAWGNTINNPSITSLTLMLLGIVVLERVFTTSFRSLKDDYMWFVRASGPIKPRSYKLEVKQGNTSTMKVSGYQPVLLRIFVANQYGKPNIKSFSLSRESFSAINVTFKVGDYRERFATRYPVNGLGYGFYQQLRIATQGLWSGTLTVNPKCAASQPYVVNVIILEKRIKC